LNQPKVMRIAAVVLLAAAAATGSYAVYRAQRTEPVLVATHNIPPYSFVTSDDFSVKYIPASAVSSDAVHTASQVNGHMTTFGILAGSQVRQGMFSRANSMQGAVDATSQPGQVTFGLSYKPGSLDSYVAPGTYVDLAAPGPNGSVLHADHVHVLSNTGYNQTVNTSGGNNQNQNEMLIMTMPQSQYEAMEQAISAGNVQVLMIPQNQRSGSGDSAGNSVGNTESTAGTSAGNTTNDSSSLSQSDNMAGGSMTSNTTNNTMNNASGNTTTDKTSTHSDHSKPHSSTNGGAKH
jgi:hypothetical protein